MNMILIMIPFLQSDVVSLRDIAEYFLGSFGNTVVKYFSAIFYDKDQMIIEQIY